MAYPIRFSAEPIREVAFGAITAFLTAVGPAVSHLGRVARFVNTTDVEVYVSLDGIDNHFRLPKNSFLLFDISTNQTKKDNLFVKEGQYFYVSSVNGAPSSGAFWIEVVIGA